MENSQTDSRNGTTISRGAFEPLNRRNSSANERFKRSQETRLRFSLLVNRFSTRVNWTELAYVLIMQHVSPRTTISSTDLDDRATFLDPVPRASIDSMNISPRPGCADCCSADSGLLPRVPWVNESCRRANSLCCARLAFYRSFSSLSFSSWIFSLKFEISL